MWNLVLLLLIAARCAAQEATPTPTLLSVVGSDDFSLLRRLLTDTNLTDVVGGASGVTLFAPSNAAFLNTAADLGIADNASADATYTALVGALNAAGPESAGQVARYHVLSNRRELAALEAGAPEATLSGLFLAVESSTNPPTIQHGSSTLPLPKLGALLGQTPNYTAFQVDRVLFPYSIRPPSAAPGKTAAQISATPSPTPLRGAPPEAAAGGAAAANDGGADGGNGGGGGSVCFPAAAIVQLANGRHVTMDALRAGDEVLVDTRGGVSPIYAFTHRVSAGIHPFVRIEAAAHALTLSARHLLYANANATPVRADSVRPGDTLHTLAGPQRVLSVRRVHAEGLYAPHTLHGDVVVDGVLCSGYTALMPRDAAHAALAAVRALARLGVKEPLRGALDGGWSRRTLGAEGFVRSATLALRASLQVGSAR